MRCLRLSHRADGVLVKHAEVISLKGDSYGLKAATSEGAPPDDPCEEPSAKGPLSPSHKGSNPDDC
jgi:hypothetical protein